MPADKQSALAALDEAFADAIKGRYASLRSLLDGQDAPEAVELKRIRAGLKDDQRAYALMTSLIEELE